MHQWNFQSIFVHWQLLLIGLGNTAKLAAVCLLAGVTLGLVVGLARYARHPLVNWPATAFIELFRNTPALVQIMWFFFAFPILVPFDVNAFTAATLGLALNTAAFCAEIYRAGIQSIHRGQWDAAKALGMNYGQQMTRIILPQAVRRMLPAFMNRFIELIKMTSLASIIAYGELVHQGKLISTIQFNPIETYTVIAFIFFFAVYPVALAVQRLELHLRRSD
jgi:polar amino acid transport system permease protein